MRLHWLLPSFLGFFLLSSPAEAARLLTWRFDADQNQLSFTTDEGVQPKAQLIVNPTRLVIDLPGISLGRPKIEQPVGGAIRSVRVGQFDAQTTRLVVELNPGYTIDPQQVKFRGISPTQWTVQLPSPEQTAQLPDTSSLLIQTPIPPSATNNPPGNSPQTDHGHLVVMVDPGHGGKDHRAIGIDGLEEKDVILPIAQRVAALLEQQGIAPD